MEDIGPYEMFSPIHLACLQRMHAGGLEVVSANASFFQLYSPKDGGLFVAEPVTHANAALNTPEEQWADLGMRILSPNEEMALVMRLELSV